MEENKKLNIKGMLSRLRVGHQFMRPLVISRVDFNNEHADARITVKAQDQEFDFAIECKSRSTTEAIESAISRAKNFAQQLNANPMIYVPFLSPARLEQLEAVGISGVDLSGNGIVQVPGKLLVFRTGNQNQFPESRTLANPYRRKSAMVARILVLQSSWNSMTQLSNEIGELGSRLSMSQISKAIKSLSEDMAVRKDSGNITTNDPSRLLHKLAANWNPSITARRYLKLNHSKHFGPLLTSSNSLRWSVTGESSVSRYATFSQGGPTKIAVTNIEHAQSLLEATVETVPSFADVELLESNEEGFYFSTVREKEMSWASKLQTWIELQNGDARQREAASDLQRQILSEQPNGR